MGPIKVSRGGTYIPDWGNEDREEPEKIKVHYRFLSFSEQQSLIYLSDAGKNLAYDSRIMAAMVKKIDNLIVDDGKEQKVIETGQELIDEPGVEELCLELWLFFRNTTSVDKKKLPLESDSG